MTQGFDLNTQGIDRAVWPFKVGQIVHAQLYDGRVLEGTVVAIVETLQGDRYRVKSGSLLVTVRPEQIIRTVR